MAGRYIDAGQLAKLRKGLRQVKPDSPEWLREFGKINKRAGDEIAARSGARLRGRRGSRSARGIKGSASAAGVRLRISNSGSSPFALADVWGTKARTGWYARERYRQSAGQQHPEWVGNSWTPGDPGEGPGRGPYGVGPALHEGIDDIAEEWADAVQDLMARFAGR